MAAKRPCALREQAGGPLLQFPSSLSAWSSHDHPGWNTVIRALFVEQACCPTGHHYHGVLDLSTDHGHWLAADRQRHCYSSWAAVGFSLHTLHMLLRPHRRYFRVASGYTLLSAQFVLLPCLERPEGLSTLLISGALDV